MFGITMLLNDAKLYPRERILLSTLNNLLFSLTYLYK